MLIADTPGEVLLWDTENEIPVPLCQTQLSRMAELQRHLPSRPRVWSKDGHRHQQRSWQHHSLGSPVSRTPSFTCGVAARG